MSIDPQTIRAEPHAEIGSIIQRDANILIERWTRRALQEQPNAARVHHRALLDHFREFLLALGQSLTETTETETNGHCLHATIHGEQRWDVGWSLPELVRDYQIFRLVILDHLEETLKLPLDHREVMAIGLALDEAITASVAMYVKSRDEHQRQSDEKRAELDRQAQESLRDKAAALQESDRHKTEFLAMLAHELRNPLAPILNAAQILRMAGADADIVSSASEMMERQVGQMVRLVDDLLDVSRISRGKIELRRGRIELASAVNHAVEAARSLVQSMEHDLILTLPPKPIYLNADPTRLAQVVGNLLNNACKFTDKGGHISLTVAEDGGQAVITVRDSGIGIATDQIPRIFDMFMQVDTSLERSVSGLGIGLTLVKSLVEMHDGTINVHSSGVGQGSEFVVRLPIAAETPQLSPQEPTASKPPMGRRILVVDDNRDSAMSLALLLKLAGNETHTAFDGLEAVEAAANFKPDLVLMDIGLPKLNGYDACRRIRALDNDTVIVALTGWGQDEDRQKSKEAGFNAHMVKPVELPALMNLLARLQTARS